MGFFLEKDKMILKTTEKQFEKIRGDLKEVNDMGVSLPDIKIIIIKL